MIFGINSTSDISKLLYVISRAANITSGIYAKYHVQILLLFVYTTTRQRFVIFTCRYFKLSWNTTALSQSNCRNFSCSSRKWVIHLYIISTLKNISTQNRNKIDLKRVYLLKYEQAVCSCRKRAFRIIYIFWVISVAYF